MAKVSILNSYFEKMMVGMRTRFGTKITPVNQTLRDMVANRKDITATAFIADQTPQPDNAHWMMFLNQETPVFLGTEKIATKMNRPVLFATVQRIKRGYYLIKIEEEKIMNPTKFSAGGLTEAHTKRLEADIEKQP